jgi:DNA-binding XRE family transcriptional regulator
MPLPKERINMNKVKLWRIERGLSQWDLAAAASIPRWAIQLIEGGHRNPTNTERCSLSKILNVEQEALFQNLSKADKPQ